MLTSFAKTHIGQRTTNEDFVLVDKKLGLYIVADGVGGLEKGDIASKIASQKVKKCIKKGKDLDYSVYEAHGALVDQIESNNSKQGMATTIAAVLFTGNNYQISWVGDTRVYLWDGKLKLLTKDDSYVEYLLKHGLIDTNELETHPDRHIISQALGMRRKEVTINSNSGTLEKNQVLLICSDGLYSIANETVIANELSLQKEMTHLTEKLVKIAVENNGIDNISLISIKSNDNTIPQDEPIKPHVVREFEFELKPDNLENTVRTIDKEETDLDLIDITKLQELTKKEKDLLESAALTSQKKNRGTNYIFPIALIVIIVLIGVLLYFSR